MNNYFIILILASCKTDAVGGTAWMTGQHYSLAFNCTTSIQRGKKLPVQKLLKMCIGRV